LSRSAADDDRVGRYGNGPLCFDDLESPIPKTAKTREVEPDQAAYARIRSKSRHYCARVRIGKGSAIAQELRHHVQTPYQLFYRRRAPRRFCLVRQPSPEAKIVRRGTLGSVPGSWMRLHEVIYRCTGS